VRAVARPAWSRRSARRSGSALVGERVVSIVEPGEAHVYRGVRPDRIRLDGLTRLIVTLG